MPPKTPLREYLGSAGLKAETFAADHGFSPWSVRHWARGDKTPSRDMQLRLSAATAGAVSPEAWARWCMPTEQSGIAA